MGLTVDFGLAFLGAGLVERVKVLLGDDLALLAAELRGVVRLVPLAERGGVDLDDGRLDEGVGADHLVVRRVVDDAENARLAGDALAGPRVVAVVRAQGTVCKTGKRSAREAATA